MLNSLWVILALGIIASILLHRPPTKEPKPVKTSYTFTQVRQADGTDITIKTEGNLFGFLNGRVINEISSDLEKKPLDHKVFGPMAGNQLVSLGILVPVNEGTESDLAAVPGINKSVARAIIGARDESGAFQSWQELAVIKGIGPKTLEVLQTKLHLDGGLFKDGYRWELLLMPWRQEGLVKLLRK